MPKRGIYLRCLPHYFQRLHVPHLFPSTCYSSSCRRVWCAFILHAAPTQQASTRFSCSAFAAELALACRGARLCQIQLPRPARISDGRTRYSQRRDGRAKPTCPIGSHFVCSEDRWSTTSPIIIKAWNLFQYGHKSSRDTSRYTAPEIWRIDMQLVLLRVRAGWGVPRHVHMSPTSDTHIHC